MLEFIFIVGSTVWGYRKIKRYLNGMKTTSRNNFNTYGDTVTIQEFEEVGEDLGDKSNEVEDNIDELKELKKTIKKSIKFQVENENLEEVLKLISHLKEVIEKIEELEKEDKTRYLAIKAKNISEKILNKIESYI